MKRVAFFSVVCMSLVLAALSSCKSHKPPAVIVSVLRNGESSFSPAIERKLLAFQQTQPKTGSGKLIIVQTILPTHEEFGNIISDVSRLSNMKPELVILDSSGQAKLNSLLEHEVARSQNPCGTQANCPSFIPSWVSGEKLDAAKKVLAALMRPSIM